MKKEDVKRGSVLRLGREARGSGELEGCLLVVTQPKSWGVEGYITIPEGVNRRPNKVEYSAQWKEFDLVGAVPPQHV